MVLLKIHPMIPDLPAYDLASDPETEGRILREMELLFP